MDVDGDFATKRTSDDLEIGSKPLHGRSGRTRCTTRSRCLSLGNRNVAPFFCGVEIRLGHVSVKRGVTSTFQKIPMAFWVNRCKWCQPKEMVPALQTPLLFTSGTPSMTAAQPPQVAGDGAFLEFMRWYDQRLDSRGAVDGGGSAWGNCRSLSLS